MSSRDATAHLVVAETPRARIRHKIRNDAVEDFAWRRDPELQHFNAEPVYDGSFESFLVQFEMDLAFGHERRGLYSIESLEGRHVGNIMYYNGDLASGTAEFGVTIADESLRGAGLGREVVVAFLRYLWRSLPYRRIVLHTLAWNVRAQRAFAAAGFKPAGTVRRHGNEFVKMEALREHWLLSDMEGEFAFATGDSPSLAVHPPETAQPD